MSILFLRRAQFRFVSAEARLWPDHLQVFPLFQPSFFLAVWYDSQPRIQRQSRQRWRRTPSSSQNSITNLLFIYVWEDIQKSTSSIPAALRKCPVGAIKEAGGELVGHLPSILLHSTVLREKTGKSHKKCPISVEQISLLDLRVVADFMGDRWSTNTILWRRFTDRKCSHMPRMWFCLWFEIRLQPRQLSTLSYHTNSSSSQKWRLCRHIQICSLCFIAQSWRSMWSCPFLPSTDCTPVLLFCCMRSTGNSLHSQKEGSEEVDPPQCLMLRTPERI